MYSNDARQENKAHTYNTFGLHTPLKKCLYISLYNARMIYTQYLYSRESCPWPTVGAKGAKSRLAMPIFLITFQAKRECLVDRNPATMLVL